MIWNDTVTLNIVKTYTLNPDCDLRMQSKKSYQFLLYDSERSWYYFDGTGEPRMIESKKISLIESDGTFCCSS